MGTRQFKTRQDETRQDNKRNTREDLVGDKRPIDPRLQTFWPVLWQRKAFHRSPDRLSLELGLKVRIRVRVRVRVRI